MDRIMKNKLSALLAALGSIVSMNLMAAEPIELRAYAGVFPASESNHFRIGSDGVSIEYFSNGAVVWTIDAPQAGKYRLTVTASCSKADDGFAEFKVTLDGKDAGKAVKLKSIERDDYDVEIELPKGEVKIAIAFTNDKFAAGEYVRNLFVHKAVLKTP